MFKKSTFLFLIVIELIFFLIIFSCFRKNYYYSTSCVSERPTTSSDIVPSIPHRCIRNKGFSHYDDAILGRINLLTSLNVTANDSRLVALVRDMVDMPSGNGMLKLARQLFTPPQVNEVMNILNKRKNGFFIDCGAYDGETASNTLYLERHLGWTGLLVEMDPYYYTQLLGRNRQVYSLNSCLSPYNYVMQIAYQETGGQTGQLRLEKSVNTKGTTSAPCFPIDSILLALNITHVDFFSLDVEGFELDVLRSVPFNRVQFDVLTVEHIHVQGGKEALKKFMATVGFYMHKDIHFANQGIDVFAEDLIFVRNDTNFTST